MTNLYTDWSDTTNDEKVKVSIPHLQEIDRRLQLISKRALMFGDESSSMKNVLQELSDIIDDATQIP
jgi:hypothetical protein